jgi:signal transduction histidine kinase
VRLGDGISVEYRNTNFTSLAIQVIREFQLSYPDADIRFEDPGQIEGDCDETRVKQIMTNLITNAIRHGEPGGAVTVSLAGKDNHMNFHVHNEGEPIPEHIRSSLFSEVMKQNNNDGDSHGLGLYIVKSIVDAHGGEIDFESTKQDGTTFTVTLPRFVETKTTFGAVAQEKLQA